MSSRYVIVARQEDVVNKGKRDKKTVATSTMKDGVTKEPNPAIRIGWFILRALRVRGQFARIEFNLLHHGVWSCALWIWGYVVDAWQKVGSEFLPPIWDGLRVLAIDHLRQMESSTKVNDVQIQFLDLKGPTCQAAGEISFLHKPTQGMMIGDHPNFLTPDIEDVETYAPRPRS